MTAKRLMRITKGQQRTLDIIEYFLPEAFRHSRSIHDISGAIEDESGVPSVQAFLDRNDKGISCTNRRVQGVGELNRLLWAEVWTGRTMQIYTDSINQIITENMKPYSSVTAEDIANGTLPRGCYIQAFREAGFLEDSPQFIIDYLKGNLFKGKRAEEMDVALNQLINATH